MLDEILLIAVGAGATAALSALGAVVAQFRERKRSTPRQIASDAAELRIEVKELQRLLEKLGVVQADIKSLEESIVDDLRAPQLEKPSDSK